MAYMLTEKPGTTAIGLKFGKPTIVIPFFGDQVLSEI